MGMIVNTRYVQIRHKPTGAVIAAGPLGWGITPFDGNYYIRRHYLRDGHFRIDHVPGLCIYKGLYVGLNYIAPDQSLSKHLGWMYWLPNPLFPFIMFRVAVPAQDPLLAIETIDEPTGIPCVLANSDRAPIAHGPIQTRLHSSDAQHAQ